MFVKHKLTSEYKVAFSRMFIASNPSITIDELVLILTKGINGDYGKTYGDFDYMVLTEWRSQYEAHDRALYFENRRQSKQIDNKRVSKSGETLGATIKNHVNSLGKK